MAYVFSSLTKKEAEASRLPALAGSSPSELMSELVITIIIPNLIATTVTCTLYSILNRSCSTRHHLAVVVFAIVDPA